MASIAFNLNAVAAKDFRHDLREAEIAMSKTGSSEGKVVQIKDRAAVIEAKTKPMGELLSRVCQTAGNRLESVAREVFDNLDDVLFDLAEKAASNASQVEFFDGMREPVPYTHLTLPTICSV